MMDDEIPPPTAEAIAFRALALIAVGFRATAEQVLRRGPDPRWQDSLDRIGAWVKQEGIVDHLSNDEWDMMNRPLGKIADRELFELGWRQQAIVPLLWSIGKIDPMPDPLRPVAVKTIQALMPLGRPIAELLASARLRPEAQIRAERERALFWNWRARCELMRRQGFQPPPGQDYQTTIAAAARSAREQGIIAEIVADDAWCDGRPYSALDQQEFADAASTALERHRALNWLCGDSDDWDDVHTST